MISADTDIRYIKGVGEKRAGLFSKLGISSAGALLRFYPRNYEDWNNITPFCEAETGKTLCFKARIISPIKEYKVRKNMTLYKFTVSDGTGVVAVTVFNGKYTVNSLTYQSEYLFYGKIELASFSAQLSSPKIKDLSYKKIRPIYPTTEGLPSATIEKTVQTALETLTYEETLPEEVRKKYDLCDIEFALKNIHFPSSPSALSRAKKRLVFEELLVLQTGLALIKRGKRNTSNCIISDDYTKEFESRLPFPLTGAQKRVIGECMADCRSDRAMNRLIQGDVGSGKTAVAAALCHSFAKNGYQSALMVPTEVLAEQHFSSFSAFFKDTGIKVCLLTGSLKKKEKDAVKEGLKNGEYDIAIGTHALITDDTEFSSLGLVITDEQHRFGVNQRLKLFSKGNNPHTLVMSATPIPRTLSMIIYGDLDISIIDEYPKNRKTVQSYGVTEDYRERIYNFIKKALDSGEQAYIVCPAVEENETGMVSAESYYEELKNGAFSDYKVGLLHGKMPAKEKEDVMLRFKNGEIGLLIATTVIEVGVDVPNATVMVIENAEHFGLSALHQLRGRIGRGSKPSTCIFISPLGKTKRIKTLCETSDGFKIADEDLKLRGPGDFLGSRQHGLPEFKIADLNDDMEVLRLAGKTALEILGRDTELNLPEHKALKTEVKQILNSISHN